MKNLVFTLLLAASGVAVQAGNPDEPKSTTGVAVMKAGSTFKLFYKSEKQSNVKIWIRSAEGQVVFTESFRKTESFMRPYNFSNLPEGRYTIEVLDQDGKKVEEVLYQRGEIKKLATLIKLTEANSKYLLAVSNKGANELTVKIYDAKSNLVYEGNENINGDFAKVYNLEKVGESFTFEVSDKSGLSTTINF